MLAEHTGRLGDDSDPFICRRIFSDGYFWLTVDLDELREVENFHLVYAFGTPAMCCYRWVRGQGLRHYRIDDGEALPLHNACPLLYSQPETQGAKVLDRFEKACCGVDPVLAVFVIRKLREGIALLAA
ncbi:MAG: hypothetical protein HC904_07775 [Blastochloris sp.]|nr:hypothetical protein [Blastochloris sp.]